MPLTAEVEITVAFHDVDVLEHVWHGHYFKYLEIARCALLQKFDYDYPQMRASGFMWPIVESSIKFVQPARYGDRLWVRGELLEYENRIKIGYVITNTGRNHIVTKAHTVQVAVDIASGELQFVSPPILFEKLKQACGTLP